MSFLFSTLSESLEERLETKHLLLRPYQEGDEGDFMTLVQENASILNPAFTGRLARVRVLEDARTQVKQLRTSWDNRRTFDFGVWIADSNTYIGNIALKNLDHKVPKAEIALYFTSWPDTRTYAKEGLQRVLVFAFDALVLNKVYIRCTAKNNFFGDLTLECGFTKEGVFRSDFRGTDSDELLDLTYFGMTRLDYKEQQQQEKQENAAVLA